MLINPFVFGGGGGGGGAYFAEVMADNPVLYLRLAELAGNPVNSGSVTLTGGSYNSVTRGQPTLCGDAGDYSVTANTSMVSATFASSAVFKANNFTLEAIIKPSDVSGTRAIISGSVGGCPYMRINNGKLNLLSSQFSDQGSSTTNMTAGNTYHVAVTVQTGGAVAFYINGVAAGTGISFASFTSGNTAAYVGQELGSFDQFIGDLDEVAVYHTALSGARIAAHAAAAGL